MSLLINLLPDLRQQKFREKQRRQLAVGLSVFIWSVCAGAIVLMFISKLGQDALINRTTDSIKKGQSELSSQSGLVDALTAQQHMQSLSSLYAKRVFLTKFFSAYSEADPKDITLTSMEVSDSNVLSVEGVAPSYAEVAKLARALDASNVKVGSNLRPGNVHYFSDIQIISATNSQATTSGNAVTFQMKAAMQSGVTSGS